MNTLVEDAAFDIVDAVKLRTNPRIFENITRKIAIGLENSDNDAPITLNNELMLSSGTFKISLENCPIQY
jgi:hypothetical protein